MKTGSWSGGSSEVLSVLSDDLESEQPVGIPSGCFHALTA